jgi:Radical SAM superfamily/4Fe-4S single cluster domain
MARLHLRAIEINAVWHCNLACVACTHASPVSPRYLGDPAVVRRDLSGLGAAADVEEIRILGGEPLLHPRLPALLQAVRGSMPSATVRISTNGTQLHRTDFEWLDYLDEIHISRYPGTRVRPEAVAELARRCRIAEKTLILKDFHSFRHIMPGKPLTPARARDVFDTCQQAHSWSCHTVHDGRVYLCPVSADPRLPDQEACPIEPVSTLEKRLDRFLHRNDPLRACACCLGTVGNRFGHQQANGKTWLAQTQAGFIDEDYLDTVRRDPLADNGCSSYQVLVEGTKRSHWVGFRV